MLSDERITEIRARCEKASVGPWSENYAQIESADGQPLFILATWKASQPLPWQAIVDREFIAHARRDIPDLLEALDAARVALEAIANTTWPIGWSIEAAHGMIGVARAALGRGEGESPGGEEVANG